MRSPMWQFDKCFLKHKYLNLFVYAVYVYICIFKSNPPSLPSLLPSPFLACCEILPTSFEVMTG